MTIVKIKIAHINVIVPEVCQRVINRLPIYILLVQKYYNYDLNSLYVCT